MKSIHFYHFDSDPRIPPFTLYVRWKSGVTFVWRYFRDGNLVCYDDAEETVNPVYYANTPMQYTTIFTDVKMTIFNCCHS